MYFILCRSGSDEEYSEKVKLLEEIKELQDEGAIVLAEKRKEKEKSAKELKKKATLKKQGEDIRLRAMQSLGDEGETKG